MTEDEDEIARRVAAMTTDELVAELNRTDPKVVRAALERVMIEMGLTDTELRALLQAALKRTGPVKH